MSGRDLHHTEGKAAHEGGDAAGWNGIRERRRGSEDEEGLFSSAGDSPPKPKGTSGSGRRACTEERGEDGERFELRKDRGHRGREKKKSERAQRGQGSTRRTVEVDV